MKSMLWFRTLPLGVHHAEKGCRLRSLPKNDNVVAVYVALGERSPAPLQKFAKDLGLDSQIVIDKFETIGARHGVTGQGQDTRLPRTFVLEPDGTVKSIFVVEGADFAQALNSSIQ